MDKRLQRKASIIQAVRKQSAPATTDKPTNKVPKRENSYRLEARNPFKPDPVFKILEEVMNAGLDGVTYCPKRCPEICMNLSALIRARVKALNFDRYKLICVVDIIERKMQSVCIVAKFLWDPERDNCAYFKYQNYHIIGAAYVFGIYYE